MRDLFSNVADPSPRETTFSCIKATQPVGDMYIASIPFKSLMSITYFDVRRTLGEERDFETYLGIQRPLDPRRVADIKDYVTHVDAAFPTSIIIAADQDYVFFDEANKEMTLKNTRLGETRPSIQFSKLARVLDGQHRIAGLEGLRDTIFELSVTIFVGADIADQAQIFATVNLEQTKVNKSLVYDLYELAKSRSPQKTCHNIAVALDRDSRGPLYQRIKRLGLASEQKSLQSITQATFVESLIRYISADPRADRDLLLRGKKIAPAVGDEKRILFLRDFFIADDDIAITRCVFNYLSAVRRRWPTAWNTRARGAVLNRTNGFRAAMRFFRYAYLTAIKDNKIVSEEMYISKVFSRIDIDDEDFVVDIFPPGSAGEAKLFRSLRAGNLVD